MIRIDAIDFDLKRGQILLPEVGAVPFRSNSITGTGVQVTQERSPGFTLTLTRFSTPSLLGTELATIRGKKGQRVTIDEWIAGVRTSYFAGGYRFVVTQARVVDWKVVPQWCGYRLSTQLNYTPALRIVSQWTLYAIPI